MKNALFLSACLLSLNVWAQTDAQAFEQYRQQQLQAYDQYVKSQQEAFKLYKQAYAQAFEQYKKGILKQWPEALVSSPKRWVSYSDQFKQRTVVDFDKQEVIVAQKLPENPSPMQLEALKRKLALRLEALKKMDYAAAFKQDQPSVSLEKAIQAKVPPAWRKQAQIPKKRVPILAQNANLATARFEIKPDQQLVQLRYRLQENDVQDRVKAVLPSVLQQAQQHKVEPALVLAIIKHESSFNPLATSHVPAYGLMQIVPTSAGKDATQYLFGQPKVLSPSYLYTPEKNIQTGVAYLHILNYRYLKHIQDPKSRRYCVIAAYNTGAGNVARSFTGSTNIRRAAQKINNMTPEQVYQHLLQHLPYDETRRYLKKVASSYQQYRTRL